MRVGIQRGVGDAKLKEGIRTTPDTDLDLGRFFASAGVDTFDNAYFPTRGLKAQALWTLNREDLGDTQDFNQISAGAFYAASSGRHTGILSLGGGDTYQGNATISSLFSLGGPFSFPGYSIDELTGESYGVARLIYRYRVNRPTNTPSTPAPARTFSKKSSGNTSSPVQPARPV